MGNSCSSADGSASSPAAANRLGGGASPHASARDAAAAAAEARYLRHKSSGIDERAERADLVGRIQELYRRRNQDAPFGLATLDVELLRKMYREMKV